MNQLCLELLRILREETACYRLILELVIEERRLLAAHQAPPLIQLVARKENVILQIRNFEEERQIVCLKIARLCNIPAENLNIRHIAEKADEPTGLKIQHARTQLLECMQSIQEANRLNRRLCENGMALVRDVMNAIAHGLDSTGAPAAPTAAYGPQGARPTAAATVRSWQA